MPARRATGPGKALEASWPSRTSVDPSVLCQKLVDKPPGGPGGPSAEPTMWLAPLPVALTLHRIGGGGSRGRLRDGGRQSPTRNLTRGVSRYPVGRTRRHHVRRLEQLGYQVLLAKEIGRASCRERV